SVEISTLANSPVAIASWFDSEFVVCGVRREDNDLSELSFILSKGPAEQGLVLDAATSRYLAGNGDWLSRERL
ncbi:hypothetical protein, partial [Escherichia coli]|uniref:hypothetical protein n=1 Tax=Escherichia coli TaxID=562 RepID=UPI001C57BA05